MNCMRMLQNGKIEFKIDSSCFLHTAFCKYSGTGIRLEQVHVGSYIYVKRKHPLIPQEIKELCNKPVHPTSLLTALRPPSKNNVCLHIMVCLQHCWFVGRLCKPIN